MSIDQRKALSANKTSTKRRVAYSLAAGAAAATTCGAPDANAAIVYSGIQNYNIPLYNAITFNLDGDAFGDIKLKNYFYLNPGPHSYQGATVSYFPGQLVGFQPGLAYVSALAEGFLIDAASVGPTFYGSMANGAYNPLAEFNNVTDAYIGLSFPTGGNTHYGWIRVDVNNAANTFVVKDWAYESVPGAGIRAGHIPEPGTLGLLAAGATGLLALRRRVAKKAETK
jgi:hypothetical protein